MSHMNSYYLYCMPAQKNALSAREFRGTGLKFGNSQGCARVPFFVHKIITSSPNLTGKMIVLPQEFSKK